MAKYVIRYTTQDGDLCGCWVEADTREEAIDRAYEEHWNINEVLTVTRQ